MDVNEFVSVHVGDDRPGIGTIVLSRPPTNTLTRQVYREISAAAQEVGKRDDVAAVIIFGGHEIFSAGDDLDELHTLNPSQADTAVRLSQEAIGSLAAIPKPTVAAITGYALGSGLSLALAADWRVSGDNVRLGYPDILAGLIPCGGGTERLPRAIGVSKAKDMMFSGRFVDATEGLAVGLVDEIAAPDNVYDAAAAWAARFVGTSSGALAAAKAAIDGRGDEARLYVDVFARAQRRVVASGEGH